MTPAPAILILAAGASSRMRGGDKLLMPVSGAPCLRVIAERALTCGVPVVVALPPDRPARAQALQGLDLSLITAHDAALGMGHSIAAGIRALPDLVTGAIVLPSDMPDLTADHLAQFVALHRADPTAIWRARDASGTWGHPVIFPQDLFPALTALTGDDGAKSVIKANTSRLKPHDLTGHGATLDLDTPEDWAAYLSASGDKASGPAD
ncbi:nucleotidyltransferase family protein [Donghicola sp. C2-DW-16]|uniref:Nucleotidyltransferase family protein n=1 Tax=Donghicola mangrovi TaxID=2729614 RepID=A0ABX2PEK8_9RHOB|nr:nucleotidyltransferase family protein [Donghicola mangrovi]NVO27813.1 nucleotidyltransferase family protein [Donghicola mangrovi]